VELYARELLTAIRNFRHTALVDDDWPEVNEKLDLAEDRLERVLPLRDGHGF